MRLHLFCIEAVVASAVGRWSSCECSLRIALVTTSEWESPIYKLVQGVAMLDVRVVEDTGSYDPYCIWEGVVLEGSIESKLALEPDVTEKIGEVDLRVEIFVGDGWVDIGHAEDYLARPQSIELASVIHDDIMDGMWDDYVPGREDERKIGVIQAALGDTDDLQGSEVIPLRRSCRHCEARVDDPYDLVCSDCLSTTIVRAFNYCASCDHRLLESERLEGFCTTCAQLFEIREDKVVATRRHWRPHGRLDRRLSRDVG